MEKIDVLYKDLKFNNEYEIVNVIKSEIDDSFTLYEVSYANKYNEIVNNYEEVYIEYIAEINLLKDIKVYNYNYEDKEIKITKEEAINIVKNTYDVNEIIEAILEIENISNNRHKQYNYESNNNSYEVENKMYLTLCNDIRKVWKITLLDNGIKRIVYIDIESGEIIYKNEDNCAEEKY